MKFNVITIFPELINDFINHGLISKALIKNIIEVQTWNPRDFSENPTGRIDDKPFGGGQGMLLQAEPLIKTIEQIKLKSNTHVIFMAPHGNVFDQNKAHQLKTKEDLTIICGRYEGIDKRVEESSVDEVISIGDFVLNGGELPALVVIETIARQLKGFIGNEISLKDSFSNGLLEHPQYTRPEKSAYGNVPEILLSGNHEMISRWELKESLKLTLQNRPEHREQKKLSDLETELLIEIKDE